MTSADKIRNGTSANYGRSDYSNPSLQVMGVQCLLGNDAPSGMHGSSVDERRFFRIDIGMWYGNARVSATDLPDDVRKELACWLFPKGVNGFDAKGNYVSYHPPPVPAIDPAIDSGTEEA